MAYDTPTLEIPDGLDTALPDMIDKAVAHSEEAFGKMQEEMTDFYKGELPGITKEDHEDGRSDIVSRDVHDAVMATMPDLVRIFTGPEDIVQFRPVGPDDEQTAVQATEVIRHIFEKENDAFLLIHGSIKDGLVRKFAIASWWHEYVDRSYVESYTLPEDEFGLFMQENEGEVEIVESKAISRRGRTIIKAKVRHQRYEHQYKVQLVPPEELILSPSARGAKGDHLIGRRQNLRKEALIGMGYPEELVNSMALEGSDQTIETGGMAAARKPTGETTTDEADEDEILYVECFVEWPHEGRMRLFKICTLGNGHEIVACEPVDEVNMALFTPDPEPHTPIGESQAEKVADIQRLKTGIWRGIIDSLAEALVPRTEVVEGQVNIEDAMSTEIGGLVRVRQPNMVRPISTPFVGQQAIPLLDSVDNMREERVGAFRAADGLSAEAMQSSTKMAVAATISGSKAQKELQARIYAHTFLVPVFRGLLKLFVQHQDVEKVMHLTGGWVPIDPSGWNADMDCEVANLAQAMLTPEEKAMQLAGIAEKQEQIIQMMGPINPLCTIGHYSETLREMVATTGRKNLDKYFMRVPSQPDALAAFMQQFSQFVPPAPPDPAAQLAEAQAKSLAEEAERKNLEQTDKVELEKTKHQDQMDLERDKLDQARGLALLEMAAKYGIQTEQTEMKIIADLLKQREQLAQQERAGAADRDFKASESERERVAQLADRDTEREHQGTQADLDRADRALAGDADREHQATQADLDRVTKDEQHERTTKTQERIAAKRAAQPKAGKAKKD